MTPKVPESYRDARRAEIVNAAAECFLEKGFHQTTMQDIFRASGLSAGAVYNYFESKDDIVTAMGEYSRARNAALVTRATGPGDRAPMAAIMASFFEVLGTAEAARWAPFDLGLFAEAARNEAIRASIHRNLITNVDSLVPLMEGLQAGGAFPADLDARSIVLALYALVQCVPILRVVDPDIDLESYFEACLAIARGSLWAPPDVEQST